MDALQAQGFKFAPLWTGIGDGSVVISSDTFPARRRLWPGRNQGTDGGEYAKGVKPHGRPGLCLSDGPDDALIEEAGTSNPERFNHVHMWQDEPFCAQLWYQKHLNATVPAPRAGAPVYTEANCHVPRGDVTWPSLTKNGMYRYPTAGVTFSDVSMMLVHGPDRQAAGRNTGPSDGQCRPWRQRPRCLGRQAEGRECHLPQQPFKIGNTRAVMIEGPSHEAIELVEVK